VKSRKKRKRKKKRKKKKKKFFKKNTEKKKKKKKKKVGFATDRTLFCFCHCTMSSTGGDGEAAPGNNVPDATALSSSAKDGPAAAASASAEAPPPPPPLESEFAKYRISSHAPLVGMPRSQCPQCGQNRKYYCYKCMRVMGDRDAAPRVRLPFPLDLVVHRTELDGKSTGVHAAILAPDDVRFFTHDGLDDTFPEPQEGDWLLFPGPDATPISEVDPARLRRVVVIDCKWNQAHRMMADERVARLPKLSIVGRKTAFWRHQRVGDEGLATIEAIHALYQEALQRSGGDPASVDDLLYYYAFLYGLVQRTYRETGKPFTKRHRKGYIKDADAGAGASGEGAGDAGDAGDAGGAGDAGDGVEPASAGKATPGSDGDGENNVQQDGKRAKKK
jgi:DTW domain-containing protein YfiP